MKKRKELFYRVTVKEDDLVFTRSIELPAEMFSKEEALRMNNVDDEADLPNTLHWDAIVGLVYDGVCAVRSPHSMRQYIRSANIDFHKEPVVVEFEGEDIGSCVDGVVVKPSRIIEKFDISRFMTS